MAMGVRADSLRDRELAQWLEQRVDSSTDDLWAASRNICAVASKELLANIPSCFVDLQTNIKLKILMSILSLPKRNVEQWRDEIEDILSLACQDIDEWVQTVAQLLKEYPTTGGISFNMESDGGQFTKTLQELRKILRRQVKGPCAQVLPLDAAYMNKQAAQSTWGVQVQQPTATSARYFSLKRKPKAAAQRIEFLQKSADAATQMKYKSGPLSSILPIRHKNTVRKVDDQTPLKGIPTQNPSKSSTSGFRPGSMNRQASNQATNNQRRLAVGPSGGSGVKLIDINETPQALEKKRRTMEAEEKAAKKAAKDEQKRLREEERLQKRLQRDNVKVLRSLEPGESRISESSTGVVSENGQIADEEAKKHLNDANSVVQPTPAYAAGLFEGVVPTARPNASTAPTIPPANAPASGGFIMNSSTIFSPPSESQAAMTMLPPPAASMDINGGGVIRTATTLAGPYSFNPATAAAAANLVSTGPPAATVEKSMVSVASSSKRAAGGSKKNAAGKKTEKADGAGGSGARKSKKRKVGDSEEPAPVASSEQFPQPLAVPTRQIISSINVQASTVPPQQQGAQVIHFQQGGVTATTARGLAQMVHNVFIPQQPAFTSQLLHQQSQQNQASVPRTVVFLQQATPTTMAASSTAGLNLYNATTLPTTAAPRIIVQQQQQQPTQTVIPSHMLASFTPSIIRQATPVIATTGQPRLAVASPVQPAGTSDDSKKPAFTITKDVMLKAQEMFRTANKLSRPEKALILGFMAGNRENPCPQMGRILTVRLSENTDMQAQPDGTNRPVMVETYFQMNYDTGEWKQIRKIRPLREGEGQMA